jgi:hypothetical protein
LQIERQLRRIGLEALRARPIQRPPDRFQHSVQPAVLVLQRHNHFDQAIGIARQRGGIEGHTNSLLKLARFVQR